MRAIGLLLAGGLLGAALAVVLVRAGDKLDAGVSLTYRCDQLALEFDARQSAEAIIEQLLVGESEARLAEVVAAAGLQMQRYEKSDDVIVVAGQGPSTRALEFILSADGGIDLAPLPGDPPCNHPSPVAS